MLVNSPPADIAETDSAAIQSKIPQPSLDPSSVDQQHVGGAEEGDNTAGNPAWSSQGRRYFWFDVSHFETAGAAKVKAGTAEDAGKEEASYGMDYV